MKSGPVDGVTGGSLITKHVPCTHDVRSECRYGVTLNSVAEFTGAGVSYGLEDENIRNCRVIAFS